MPYHDGQRVTQDEYVRLKRIAEGREPDGQSFHTGPNGENPAPGPELDPETEAPKAKAKAGKRRSSRSTAKVTAAIADATGTDAADLPDVPSIEDDNADA